MKHKERRNGTKGIGSRQQKFRIYIDSLCRPKITRRKCEICKRKFHDYPGCVLIDSGMRYVLCKTHLRVARNHRNHFRVVVEAFRLGTPVTELGAVV